MRLVMVLALGMSLLAGTAAAKPPLREVDEINDGLLAIGIADRIRRECPAISARLLRAYKTLKAIEARAKAMGYSDAEIRAYRKSDAEKARMLRRGESYLAARGVTGDAASYCALGRSEIEKGSSIGRLLWASD